MQLLLLFHILAFLCILSFGQFTISSGTNSSYTPPDLIALNCGDHGESTAQDGRKWTRDTDTPSIFIPSQQPLNTSSASTASTQDSAPQVPYMTARIFHSSFTYTFRLVSDGPKFIRLHFHPASYSGLNISTAFFTVTINDHYTLLHNFSALLTARYLNQTYFFKEFCLNMVSEQQSLNITFVPSPNSFGFINGIEVVSIPTNLYVKGLDIPIIGQSQPLVIYNTTTLETVYRLNVGGLAISPVNDTGMFRGWSDDSGYIYGAATGVYPYHFTIKIQYTKVPPYTAPEILYRTARSMGTSRNVNENYNLTWLFPVDSGFFYLVRLHFCEVDSDIKEINDRVFEIFLNNQTADDQMDIIVYAGLNGVPIYRDFVVMVPQGSGGKQDLWLALHPNTRIGSKYSDALLNGLEIFKLNKSDGSLAGPNPDPVDDRESDVVGTSIKKMGHHSVMTRKAIIVAVVLSGALVVFILFCFAFRQKRVYYFGSSSGLYRLSPFSKSGSGSTKTKSLPSEHCHHFSLAEIKSATNDFSEELLIGVGGFGNVYKGCINGGDTPVAIKRLNPESRQGAHEFYTEIEMLSQLRHVHLVSLVGYCEEQGEMILVYDYMARGSIRDHLYNTDKPPLSWKQRLQICIGAARGLHYLHSGAKQMIIHRDIKSTNILLDDQWVAKLADFGLSKLGPTGVFQTHVSTAVKGSFGYMDPEYYRRQQVTEKSDVYSFGVVLFEVLCGRPPLDKNVEKDVVNLSVWARSHYQSGTLNQIVDPHLKGKIAARCLKKFGEIADRCLVDQGIERPAMADVLWNLEFALQLQESAEENGVDEEIDCVEEDNFRAPSFDLKIKDDVDGDAVPLDMSNRYTVMGKSGEVFSEIKSPRGR